MSNPTQHLVNNTHKGIAAGPLKITAIVGMTLNHVALIFPIPPALAAIFICAGMITMPLMCLFIAEGFQHTTNIKRYAGRLFLFTVVSHFAFNYALSPIGVQTTSVMWTLLLGFIALVILENKILYSSAILKVVLVALILIFSLWGDWGGCGVAWIISFYIFSRSKQKQVLFFVIVGISYFAVTSILFAPKWTLLAVFSSIPLILAYDGNVGKQPKWLRTSFYFFYPVHLIVLRMVYNLIF